MMFRVEYRGKLGWKKLADFEDEDEAYGCMEDQYYFDQKNGEPFVKYRVREIGRKTVKNRNEKSPADFVFRRGQFPGHSFLFEDGTFGYVGDPEFDITEFLEDEDWEIAEFIEDYYYGMLDGEQKAEAERMIRERFGGRIPIGNLYIDRWDRNGEFYQGGCFLYYEGERFRDYCDRNGEPYPVREIPGEIIDIFESGDLEMLRKRLETVLED